MKTNLINKTQLSSSSIKVKKCLLISLMRGNLSSRFTRIHLKQSRGKRRSGTENGLTEERRRNVKGGGEEVKRRRETEGKRVNRKKAAFNIQIV